MQTPVKIILSLTCALYLAASSGCALLKPMRVAAAAHTLNDVATAAAKQSDLTIIRQGSPAYLMLIDGLIEAYPKNRDLLLAGCRAYSSYASTFEATADPGEASTLYQKAKQYGFRALSHGVDFGKAAGGSLQHFKKVLNRYGKKDVPALFWTASAWASWISLNTDDVAALADMPMLEATMKRLLELDGAFYYGGPHLLMGVYLAAKPAALGGNLGQAKAQFQQAFALGSDKLLMAKVLYAKYYARKAGNRSLYVKTLQQVLAAPANAVPDLTLANTVAKKQARALLAKTEEYFATQPLAPIVPLAFPQQELAEPVGRARPFAAVAGRRRAGLVGPAQVSNQAGHPGP